ncbi:hypothetical protein AC612_16175 [Xanthomonas citri pv. fuscans]|uniref:Uncharacterized protein n=1 Tax=Xanthomonas citri pv. phaseoli var. fuscans TaxID=473423 RepID=A0A808FB73_XANCI|nr:hypothetical protein [Xanthomonas citri]ATS74963.1 hypothetical protein XcfCFBP6975P_03600 [Xanthomonas citri pv. phaseoli var. fuscans]AZU18530.1 hypothetical protein AC613_16165 [Xanthomonas citri pv. fuscans]AZU22508.1 hypothetical protein AC612_16175 [Xanthomonas citri pv. fuscans]AZU93793.1 hypothetical protein AC614_16170 [Xanthomonas citri pv. fuscans]KKY03318.1 hypothetical protein NY96_28090 [Xanthomonas citri pv. fuscans]
MPNSKSRSKALLTNSAATSRPSKVKIASTLAITVGALRNTLPIPPPICTASLDSAAAASNAYSAANNHKNGERSCSRSSKRRNARIMAVLRQAANACLRRRWK